MSYLFLQANAKRIPLPDGSVHCCVTSPPYFGLRDYGVDGQVGLEKTPAEYVANLIEIFREVRRVLRDDGTMWVVIGDSFSASGKSGGGSQGKRWSECGADVVGPKGGKWSPPPPGYKPKDLLGIPWMVAFALRDDGWYLRMDNIWYKRNPMRESVTDRPTKCHEYMFLFSKKARYYYDKYAVMTPSAASTKARLSQNVDRQEGSHRANAGGKTNGTMKAVGDEDAANKLSVWDVPTKPLKIAHFATFPPALIEPCVKAGTSERGCCPKCGAPWRRVVEKSRKATRPGTATKTEGLKVADFGNRDPGRHVTSTRTVGWESSCTCMEAREPRPCTVLDPFGGAMTTSLVSEALGRDSVCLELKPEYIEIGHRRMAEAAEKAEADRLKALRPKRARAPRAPRVLPTQMDIPFPEAS